MRGSLTRGDFGQTRSAAEAGGHSKGGRLVIGQIKPLPRTISRKHRECRMSRSLAACSQNGAGRRGGRRGSAARLGPGRTTLLPCPAELLGGGGGIGMCALCSGRSGGRGRRVWQLVASLIAAVVLLAAACSSSRPSAPGGPATAGASTEPGRAVIPPATPAGAQFGWLIAVMAHLPMSDAEERTHFDPGYRSRSMSRAWLSLLSPCSPRTGPSPSTRSRRAPVMLGAIKGAFTLAARR